MIITKIMIYNFGPFSGKHEITFSEDGQGVHIIRGGNGQGKTSLQRAVLWGLYGKVLDRKGRIIRPTSLLNRSAFKDGQFLFWVRIFFNHEDNRWTISREMTARIHQDSRYYKGMKLHIVKEGKPQPNPQSIIEKILPFDVNRFFFFDGEMLRDYEELLDQSSTSMKILKESIEHILGIPYLRLARDDLVIIKKNFEKDRAKLIRRLGGANYTELANDYQFVSGEIDRQEGLIKNLEEQMEQLELEILDYKRKLMDLEQVRELAQNRLSIEQEIKINEERAESEQQKLKKLNQNFYKTILLDISENIRKKLTIKHDTVMSKYNQKQHLLQHVNDLEKSKKNVVCRLCGAVLNENKLKEIGFNLEETKRQINLLTEIPEPNLEYERYRNIINIMRLQKIERSDFEEVDKTLQTIAHKIASLNSQLNTIKEKLINIDEEEPFKIETKIRESEREYGRLEGEAKKERESLLINLSIKSDLDQKLSSINEEEINIYKERIALSDSVFNIFESAISSYRELRRKDVEAYSTNIFQKLRSKEDFEKLEINDNFGLNIITKSGSVLDKAEWRSAGEEQIVALSLIGALNTCALIKAPIFMDTPFSRLDSIHSKRVLSYIPNMSDQIILLVTDRELRKEDESYLNGKIKSDHSLIYRGEERGSFIIQTSDEGV